MPGMMPINPRINAETASAFGELNNWDNTCPAMSWVADTLARGERIAGFGHRMYRGRADPRSAVLLTRARRLAASSGSPGLLEKRGDASRPPRDQTAVEIPDVDPQLQGVGRDDSTQVSLPFSFYFYGQEKAAIGPSSAICCRLGTCAPA